MKSAYELAMERFGDDDDIKPLTEEQKKELANIEEVYKARIAEKEIFLGKKIMEALQDKQLEEADKIKTQLKNEKIRLNEEMEATKNKVRNA